MTGIEYLKKVKKYKLDIGYPICSFDRETNTYEVWYKTKEEILDGNLFNNTNWEPVSYAKSYSIIKKEYRITLSEFLFNLSYYWKYQNRWIHNIKAFWIRLRYKLIQKGLWQWKELLFLLHKL